MPRQFAIEKYVEQKNAWRKIFGDPPLSLMFDAKEIGEMIDSDLSPENLSCDGEIPASQVRARRAHMERIASEFRALHPNIVLYEFS